MPTFTLDALIDLVAERLAAKLRKGIGPSRPGGVIEPRLLTVKQAAVRLGRSREAVQHMVASRKLPTIRDGRRVFLDVKDLDDWIAANRSPAQD